MTSNTSDARISRIRTRLETSLMRLQDVVRRQNPPEAAIDSMYAQWQNRWATRRDDLARRLTAIDTQLDSWASPAADAPRLALVGDGDEPVPMSSIDLD